MSTYYNPFSLSGKEILVTGASSGIGRATAIECSRLGAKVIISGRDKEKLEQTLSLMENENHTILIADMNNPEQVDDLINKIAIVDGVVLCAGINEITPIKFSTPKKFEYLFRTNFFSTVEFLRLLLKFRKIKSGGSIVAISSIGGIRSFDYGNGIYGASKAALSSWLKFVAQEVSIKKIRVNMICPGMVETPLIKKLDNYTAEQIELDTNSYLLKRYGKAEEIAYACVYFLSDASKWVTGTNFIIDGGRSL